MGKKHPEPFESKSSKEMRWQKQSSSFVEVREIQTIGGLMLDVEMRPQACDFETTNIIDVPVNDCESDTANIPPLVVIDSDSDEVCQVVIDADDSSESDSEDSS